MTNFYATLKAMDRNNTTQQIRNEPVVGVIKYDNEKQEVEIISTNLKVLEKWIGFFTGRSMWHLAAEFPPSKEEIEQLKKSGDYQEQNPLGDLEVFGYYPSGLEALSLEEKGELEYYRVLSTLDGAKKRSIELFKKQTRKPELESE